MDAIEKLFHECETEWHPEGPVFETKAARKLYVRLTEENERYRKALENALGNVEREHHAWRSWHDEARAALAKREERA